MQSRQQTNGNSQLNSTRESFNGTVSKLYMLGSTKRVVWGNRRTNRSI